MKILAISDMVVSSIYSPHLMEVFGRVDLVVACGDLPYEYIDYVVSSLNVPTFFVRGNHDSRPEPYHSEEHHLYHDRFGATDLHRRVMKQAGLLLAGVEGCIWYRPGPYQYSQMEMWLHVLRLAPHLIINRGRYGRSLDIFVTHAPSTGIYDQPDLPHQGVHAFRWLVQTFKPRYHLHGHIHTYRPDTIMQTQVGPTTVINAFGYRLFQADFSAAGASLA